MDTKHTSVSKLWQNGIDLGFNSVADTDVSIARAYQFGSCYRIDTSGGEVGLVSPHFSVPTEIRLSVCARGLRGPVEGVERES